MLVECKHIDDGSMNQKERQRVVDKIKTDEEIRIILMSFKAGGVGELIHHGVRGQGNEMITGLNLTACNNVILVDLWWNPALEVRRVFRRHRLRDIDQIFLSGPGVWTGAPHWTEEASKHMEVDDRWHCGRKNPRCMCFVILGCVDVMFNLMSRDSFKTRNASWRSLPYPERPEVKRERWVWMSLWICSSRATIMKRMGTMTIEYWMSAIIFVSFCLCLYAISRWFPR